ncbi:ribonuclease K6 isoform X2 [Trichechus manatus latirostris]|nr:ribonuclease K6 isoform X2 [Trichechus manatus latirostris]
MVLDLLGCFPHLLLLLGVWGPVNPLFALPNIITRAQWFKIQHLQPSPLPCNRAMSIVNKYTQHCKPENTFLHDSFENVTAICDLPRIICKNGRYNCHKSPRPINMTNCSLTTGNYPNCSYSNAALYKFFVVACDPPQPTDPPYHLVPVHLDKIV